MNFKEFKKTFQKRSVEEVENDVPDKITLSICVQTYNQENYISQCLDSILKQKTDFPIELLLGDDFSTDRTREICLDYARKYPDKIRLFLHDRSNNIKIDNKDTGLFNSLFNFFSAKGKYIAYCDGDDFWTDEFKLQKQIDFLERNENYAICYHDAFTIDKEGKKISKSYMEQMGRDFNSEELKKVLVQPPISTWCFRNVLQEIPLQMTKTINADNFWISLLGFYGHGKYLPNVKPSGYRIHSNGIWSLINRDAQLLSKKKTYDILSKFYKEKGNVELSYYFKVRSRQYMKMLLFSRLKSFNLNSIILKVPKYFKWNFLNKN